MTPLTAPAAVGRATVRAERASLSAQARRQGILNSRWLLVPALAAVVLLFLMPLLRMLELSLFDPAFTLAHYAEFLGTGTYVLSLIHI